MKKFIIELLIVALPSLSIIIGFNYFVDPANVYHDEYVMSIIEGIAEGKNVTNVGNKDERLYKRKLIELNKGKHFDYVIFGPSQIMTISSDAFPGKSVLNLGVSACKLEDYIAIFQICEDNNISYDNAIIGPVPTLFNKNDGDSRWLTNKDYYYQCINKVSSFEIPTKVSNLFSVTYFKSALLSVLSSKSNKTLEYTDQIVNKEQTDRIDGSLYYGVEYINTPQMVIDEGAKKLTHGSFNNFNELSKERVELFEFYINKVREKTPSIYFYFSPYHPNSYSEMIKNKALVESMSYLKQFAEKNGINVIGDFNPDTVKFGNTMFYDGMHPRMECIYELVKSGL